MSTELSPRVTIVVSPRERFSLAPMALETIVERTPKPYRLIYLDLDAPAWLRAELAARAEEWNLEVRRFDAPGLWPHQARAQVARGIDTEYAVFVDDDVRVHAGWLDRLVRCADETGAGVVGPLYLWSDGVKAPTIHMAGGKLTESTENGKVILGERHEHMDEDPKRVLPTLVRRRCGFVEFHCMLVRGELARDPALWDDGIVCVHEHIDLCRTARARGLETWFEPAAQVEYLAFADYLLEDLPKLRARWAPSAVDASIAAFAAKWNVLDDARSFGGVRRFARDHVLDVDPVALAQPDAATPMRREELATTRSALLDLAASRGYSERDLAALSECYHLAQLLVDGGYRPCGRPFVNHLAGTASVLVRYGFAIEPVSAAMLHAAYSHAPAHAQGPGAAVAAICAALGGRGSPVEHRVRAYSCRDTAPDEVGDLATLAVFDAEQLALVAANELEMHLAREFRYTGRGDAIPDVLMAQIAHACELLGVSGLHDALARERAAASAAPDALLTRVGESYRIAPDRRGAVRMVTGAAAALEPPD